MIHSNLKMCGHATYVLAMLCAFCFMQGCSDEKSDKTSKPDLSSPKEAVESMLKACLRGDREAFLACCTDEFRANVGDEADTEFFRNSKKKNSGKELDWRILETRTVSPSEVHYRIESNHVATRAGIAGSCEGGRSLAHQ